MYTYILISISRPDKSQATAVSNPTGSEIQMAEARWRKNDTRSIVSLLVVFSHRCQF